MKYTVTLIFALMGISCQILHGQVAINASGSQPNASAMLDVASPEKGMLIPRMTTVQKLAIASPAEGLMVYDTDQGAFCYYHIGAWKTIAISGGETYWSLTGNAGIIPYNQFIGTTDTSRLVFKVNNMHAGLLERNGITLYGCLAGQNNRASSNTFIGNQAGFQTTTGNWNTALGFQSLLWNTTGHTNTALGVYSLQNNLTGNSNFGAGHQALGANQTGSYNTAVGVISSIGIVSGESNTAVGYSSLSTNLSGNNNTAIGRGAGVSTGNLNNTVAVGYNSLATQSNEVRLGNDMIVSLYCKGAWAATSANSPNMVVTSDGKIMRSTSPQLTGSGSATQVTFWTGSGTLGGSSALYWDNTNNRLGIGTGTPANQLELTGSMRLPANATNTAGVIYKGNSTFIHDFKPQSNDGNNTFVGIGAGNMTMQGALSMHASNNTGVGRSSLIHLTTGYDNTAIGSMALSNNQVGFKNCAVGYGSMALGQEGNYNTALGSNTLMSNTGNFNTAGGYNAAYYNAGGSENTVIGAHASVHNQGGHQNAVFGTLAGNGSTENSYSNNSLFGYGAGQNLTTGSSNVFLGSNAGAQHTSGSNNIIIGVNINAPSLTGDNQVVIGAQDLIYGNLTSKLVGIGTAAPGQTLTVDGTFGLLETGASPAYHTIFRGGDQTADITYTLPVNDGNSGEMLTTDGTGLLSWQTPSTGDITAVGSMTGGDVFAGPSADNQWLGLGAAAGRIEFDDQATDEVNILDARVGIGTSTPTQQLQITGSFAMPKADGTNGIIYKNDSRFLHDYNPQNTSGRNTFIGYSAGNFTMTGGAYNFSSDNTGIGHETLKSLTTGYQNTSIGALAAISINTGSGNTAVGTYALMENQNGSENTAVGGSAAPHATGNGNTAMGYMSLFEMVNGAKNTVSGNRACFNPETGEENTVIGYEAGYGAAGSGFSRNSLFGYKSGRSLSTGNNNILLGYQAGDALTSGSNNIVIGYDIDVPVATGNNQLVIGASDLLYGDITNKRIGIGTTSPGQKLTVDGTFGLLETGASPTYHTIFQGGNQTADITYTLPVNDGNSGEMLTTDGSGVLSWTSAGTVSGSGMAGRLAFWSGASTLSSHVSLFWDNINARLGIGTNTPNEQLELTGNLRLPASTSTTGIIYAGETPFIHNVGSRNNFMGQFCGNLSLSGAIANSAIGDSAMYSLTSGDYNVALGEGTLKNLTSAHGNVAIGRGAGRKVVSNGYNTIIGYQAGVENTADRNTFLGCETGFQNTSGHYNAFIGHQAGYKNTTANNSVAIGYRALYTQTGETTDNDLNNVAVGYEALYTNNPTLSHNGRYNVAVGHKALWANSTGFSNTATGYESLLDNTTGHDNTSLGFRSLYNITTGYENTAIGSGVLMYSGNGYKNTAVGFCALTGNSSGYQNTAIGHSANVASGNLYNTIVIGFNANVNTSDKAVIGNSSVTTVGGYGAWVNYSDRRLKENIRYTDAPGLNFILKLKTASYNYIDDQNKRRRDGMIAQDVHKALTELGLEFSGLVIDNDSMQTMNLSYGEFVIPLVNAIKEQQQTIEALQGEIETLKANYLNLLKKQEEMLSRLQ